jgi:hypothetical protein
MREGYGTVAEANEALAKFSRSGKQNLEKAVYPYLKELTGKSVRGKHSLIVFSIL